VGNEFLVNNNIAGDQKFPSVTILENGSFIITWQSAGDGNGFGIYARIYNATGAPITNEFLVNNQTGGDQTSPDISSDKNGNFVIVWEEGTGNDIFAKTYSSDHSPLTNGFQVNTYTTNLQSRPKVSLRNDSSFVVVWQSAGQDTSFDGVYGQRFWLNGSKIGNEFQVNSFTTGQQDDPAVDYSSSGDFIVVYNSEHDGSGYGVFGQIFGSMGSKKGNEFQINNYTNSSQYRPDVRYTRNDDFLVVWQSIGQDGSAEGVYGQWFNRSGNKITGEYQINQYFAGEQLVAKIGMGDLHESIITWMSESQDLSGWGVYARVYNQSMLPVGNETLINQETSDDQRNPRISAIKNGYVVITWSSNQDGSGQGIYARIYAFDQDGDGVLNDNCPDVYNLDQADADGDGIGNLCDNCPSNLNPSQEDIDGDSVGDICDNCPSDFNSDQTDADNDGFGEVCDCNDGDDNVFPPSDGMSITSNTILCTGSYSLSNGISITADNLILQCNNTEIVGSSTTTNGITLHDGAFNVTINNCNVTNYFKGIFCYQDCNDNILQQNNLYNNEQAGIVFSYRSNNNIFRENFVSRNGGGITPPDVPCGLCIDLDTHDNLVYNNIFSDNLGYGLNLQRTQQNNITNNTFINNTITGLGVDQRVSGPGIFNQSALNNIWNNIFQVMGVNDSHETDNTYCVDCLGNNYFDGATGPQCPSSCFDPDNDGINSTFDNCPNLPNTNQSDFDNDTVGDICDNCFNVNNTGQEDDNNNSVGNLCEPTNYQTKGGLVNMSCFIGDDPVGLTNVQAVDENTLPQEGKPDLTFIFGLFSFEIENIPPGSTVDCTLTLPSTLENAQYWKYGPNGSINNPQPARWYQIPMVTNRNNITINIIDGGVGDDTGAVNGHIIDQGGPGVPSLPIPAMPWTLAVMLGLVFILIGHHGKR